MAFRGDGRSHAISLWTESTPKTTQQMFTFGAFPDQPYKSDGHAAAWRIPGHAWVELCENPVPFLLFSLHAFLFSRLFSFYSSCIYQLFQKLSLQYLFFFHSLCCSVLLFFLLSSSPSPFSSCHSHPSRIHQHTSSPLPTSAFPKSLPKTPPSTDPTQSVSTAIHRNLHTPSTTPRSHLPLHIPAHSLLVT